MPDAADVEDGALTYRLDVDPQGMVTPEQVDVTVHFPRGTPCATCPRAGPGTDRRTATWSVDGLVDSPRWALTGRPQGSAG